MPDIWVHDSQVWLNETYGGTPGYVSVPETGNTGWSTMFGLTRALQHELGIAALSDTFGPTTLSQLTTQYGNISATLNNDNIAGIIQAALWCKGYSGGLELGTWDQYVTSSIALLRTHMGMPTLPTPTLTPKMFKSLLTMDAYIRIGTGTSEIREVQQWLNGRYSHRANFYIMPCDGYFSRDVQKGLLYAIQYELGMTDSVANGNFGPSTQQGIRDYGIFSFGATDTTKQLVHLYKAALIFNRYVVPFDGYYGWDAVNATTLFQGFVELPQTGNAFFATWASLLVSTGDVTRVGTASDTNTPLTASKATTLYNAGYRTVGRYLTVATKRYQPGELGRIFAAGLSTFPIYQNYNDSIDDFIQQPGAAENPGRVQGKAAALRARQLGFKAGTTIYFAVDYDATGDEIAAVIIPFFEEVAQGVASSHAVPYQIGIYGTRNVCSRVSAAGLATSSFVSGMSTGYSGNLGFALPSNWAYDQIQTTTLGSGTAQIAIDKDIKSVRATPANSGAVSTTPLFTQAGAQVFDEGWYWKWVEAQVLAETAALNLSSVGSPSTNDIVLHYLSKVAYWDGSVKWQLFAPLIESSMNETTGVETGIARVGFAQSVAALTTSTYSPLPALNGYDIAHFAASVRGYRAQGIPLYSTEVAFSDVGAWAGDLATLWTDYENARIGGYADGPQKWCDDMLGNAVTSFDTPDLRSDADAFLVAKRMHADPDRPVADIIRELRIREQADPAWRYGAFIDERFGGDRDNVAQAAADIFTTTDVVIVNSVRALMVGRNNDQPVRYPPVLSTEPTDFGMGFALALERKSQG